MIPIDRTGIAGVDELVVLFEAHHASKMPPVRTRMAMRYSAGASLETAQHDASTLALSTRLLARWFAWLGHAIAAQVRLSDAPLPQSSTTTSIRPCRTALMNAR